MVKKLDNKHPEYYESVLQLRDTKEEVNIFVKEEIAKAGIHIMKVVDLRNGYDYYLTDAKFASKLGQNLQNKYGGYYLTTATLFSRKDDKDVYRMTTLFRGVNYTKGDLVDYKGEQYHVEILRKDIILIGKSRVHVKWKDAEQIKKVE